MPTNTLTEFQSPIIWTDGGTPQMTLANLASGAIRIGAQHNLGSLILPTEFKFEMFFAGLAGAGVVGVDTIQLFFGMAHTVAANVDGNIGVADVVGLTSAIPNLTIPIVANIQTTTATDDIIISGVVRLAGQYISPAILNNTGVNLENVTTHFLKLIPMVPQFQN